MVLRSIHFIVEAARFFFPQVSIEQHACVTHFYQRVECCIPVEAHWFPHWLVLWWHCRWIHFDNAVHAATHILNGILASFVGERSGEAPTAPANQCNGIIAVLDRSPPNIALLIFRNTSTARRNSSCFIELYD